MYASRGSHRLHYDVVGDDDAPPVLLIMGMAFSSRAWDALPARLVESGLRVITFDNRGTGRSERPRGFFRVAEMADDAAAVLDAVGVARAHVFGISMGGMTALELAVRHRERLDSLVLGCTYAGYRKSHKPAFKITRALLASSIKRGGALERIAPVLVSDATFKDNRDAFASWMTRVERAAPRVVGLQMAAVLRHTTEKHLAAVDVPTLVITGDADRLVPPENSRVLAKLIPGAELVELKGAGHCFPFERLEETSSALLSFFHRVRVA